MNPTSESFLRTLLAVGLSVTLIGIALSATENASLGSWLVIVGLIALVFGLHRFGRTGPDRPFDLSAEADAADHER